MPRPRNAVPSRNLHLMLAEEDAARLELHLWSEAEQRIPLASRQRFFTARIREFFARKSLDLAPYFSGLPSGSVVYGSPQLIERLQLALEDGILARGGEIVQS